jgi:hypothetical protein
VLLLLFWQPPGAIAQPATSYTLKVCPQGASCATPVLTHTLPASEVVCGQSKSAGPTDTVANPRFVRWDDPAAVNQFDCVWDSGATSGPLFSLPFSTTIIYDAVLSATNSVGTGAESARSNPFNRPGSLPAARTGLRVLGS